MRSIRKIIFNIIFFTAFAALLFNDLKRKINILSVLLILAVITSILIISSLFIKNKRFRLYSIIYCLPVTLIVYLYAWFESNDDYGKLGIFFALIPGIVILFLGSLIYAVIPLVKKDKKPLEEEKNDITDPNDGELLMKIISCYEKNDNLNNTK